MVESFPEQPVFRPYEEDLDLLVTVGAVRYVSDLLPGGEITIPDGFTTDGASIPWGLWWLTGSPFLPRFQTATLLHDYQYRFVVGTQKNADLLFLHLLKRNEVKQWRRRMLWVGLRMFGWVYWNDIFE